MAELSCGVASEIQTSPGRELSPREARRRRMEIRRFKFVPSTLESERKRLKIDGSVATPFQECEKNVENSGAVCCIHGRAEGELRAKPEENLDLIVPPRQLALLDKCPKYGKISVCGRRRDMEDTLTIRPSLFWCGGQIPARLHFFGVYDGHGCAHVSKCCKVRFHKLLVEELGNTTESQEWQAVMERTFFRMDKEVVAFCKSNLSARCRCELQTPQCDAVGSTAVVAIVAPDKIVVANCGDSRAILFRGGKAIPLSFDHKPDRPDELLRIQASGGRVIYWDGPRVLGVLAMSRAIGDSYLKPYVIPVPEVSVTERCPEDDCLILASDGLWDVVPNKMACDIVHMCLRGNEEPQQQSPANDDANQQEIEGSESSDKACSDAAMLLTKLALARGSMDNVTVIVIDLKRNR